MSKLDKESVIGITALLVHAANIDENYSDHEKELVKEFIKSYLKDENSDEILKKAEEIEKNSNQLLNYTNIIKQNSLEIKTSISFSFSHKIFSAGDWTLPAEEPNIVRLFVIGEIL